jgi:hypothetical protein
MQWFGGNKRKEVWEDDLHSPFGDIEAAEKIRSICRSVADSAERVGVRGDRTTTAKRRDKKAQRDGERYHRAASAAMAIAMKISDDLMRDAAVREIVDLCLKASDVNTAQTLFGAIQTEAIRAWC